MVLYELEKRRRRVSKKPPMTMNFSQSPKAESDAMSAMSEDRSVGKASGTGAAVGVIVALTASPKVPLLRRGARPVRIC